MISCRFAARLSPRVSEICLDKLASKSLLIHLLNSQYAEVVPVCLSLLCIPIRDRLPAQYLNSLMGFYLKSIQIDIKDEPDLPSLKKLFSPYLDIVYNLSDGTSSQRDSLFVVQLISMGILHTSRSNKIQNAMLRHLVCPILTSIQLDNPGQISLAFDFASAFIRLLTNISEPKLIDLITDTLAALNHIILITDVSLPYLELITCAFVDYLTSSMSCPSNLASPFSEIFKTVLINFLQLLLRCVETDKSGIPSDCRSFAWMALCNVLSQSLDNDSPIILIQQGEQLHSVLCQLIQFAEVHFRTCNEFLNDFDPTLIEVLLKLYLQMKQKLSLESIPLNFANSAFIDQVISFCFDKGHESLEILEPLEGWLLLF
ncbi:unnamed protein product [Rodentolepis nana]|uniref:Uncharacterized protein n=1 Tax=Rodentolepis nana TaxID=102285 RepID=A0A0R3TFY1_RODNA|nr:unnamed protein product [Rodentolepis nana]